MKMHKENRKGIWPLLAGLGGAGILSLATVWTVLAQSVPAPVLTITSISTNQFQIVITNGVSTTNYEIFRTTILNDPLYPWTLHLIGAIGQTNFTVSGGIETIGFFRAKLGVDCDMDGVPDWQDAQPTNPAVSNLVITIDSPVSGSVFN